MQDLGPRQSLLMAVMLFSSVLAAAQQNPVRGPSAVSPQIGQGNLVVMCTVTASVAIVIGPDKAPYLVKANAADPADNVSEIKYFAVKPVRKEAVVRAKNQGTPEQAADARDARFAYLPLLL
jgi:hypothetical protein